MRTFISAALHSSQQTHLQYTRAAAALHLYAHTHWTQRQQQQQRERWIPAKHLIFQLALDSYIKLLCSRIFSDHHCNQFVSTETKSQVCCILFIAGNYTQIIYMSIFKMIHITAVKRFQLLDGLYECYIRNS